MNRITAASVAALAGLVVLTPTVAHAGEEETADAKRDVLRTNQYRSHPVHEAPLHRRADITEMTTSLGPEQLVLTASMREVNAGRFWAYFDVKTSQGMRLDGMYWRDRERGRMVERAYFGNEQEIECPVSTRLDRQQNTILMSVPASCLDDPEWVRTGLTTFAFGDSNVYYDDARRDGKSARDASKLGPRVYAE